MIHDAAEFTEDDADRLCPLRNLNAEEFLSIIQENKSEFPIMSYLAKIYFQRYIHAMREFEQQIIEKSSVHVWGKKVVLKLNTKLYFKSVLSSW